jgi:hypothetical protein
MDVHLEPIRPWRPLTVTTNAAQGETTKRAVRAGDAALGQTEGGDALRPAVHFRGPEAPPRWVSARRRTRYIARRRGVLIPGVFGRSTTLSSCARRG